MVSGYDGAQRNKSIFGVVALCIPSTILRGEVCCVVVFPAKFGHFCIALEKVTFARTQECRLGLRLIQLEFIVSFTTTTTNGVFLRIIEAFLNWQRGRSNIFITRDCAAASISNTVVKVVALERVAATAAQQQIDIVAISCFRGIRTFIQHVYTLLHR